MSTLTRTLKVCARTRKLSHTALARELGISRSGLYALLSGKHEFGRQTLGKVLAVFPELDQEVLDYIRDGHEQV